MTRRWWFVLTSKHPRVLSPATTCCHHPLAVQRRQASDVADSLWASASGRDELSSQQAAARAEQLPLVLQHGDARAVSDSLWAWATLGQPLSGPLAAAAEEAILRRAPKMTPHEVDSTLWAYAHSGWQLRREVAAALEARLLWALQQRSQPEYLADDLCSLCSLLHLRGSPLPLDDGLRTVLKSQLLYVLQQGERDHGTPWATHAVATSLSHWTQLDLPIDDELRAAADAAVVHLAPDMNGKEVMQVSSAHANGCWQLGAEPAAAVAARQRHLEHISSIDF